MGKGVVLDRITLDTFRGRRNPLILDLKNCPEHGGCRVFHAETGEEIFCDYADDVAGIVRGCECHLEDGHPVFHRDADGTGVRRHECRAPIRIECPPGVALEPVPPVAIECPWAERFPRVLAAVGRGDPPTAPMTHPDCPGYFARDATAAAVPRPGAGLGEPPEMARIVVRFAPAPAPAHAPRLSATPIDRAASALHWIVRRMIGLSSARRPQEE